MPLDDPMVPIGDGHFENIFCQVDGNDPRLHGWTPSDAEQVAMSQFYFGTSIPQNKAREESISSFEHFRTIVEQQRDAIARDQAAGAQGVCERVGARVRLAIGAREETAKANGLEPYANLRRVFTEPPRAATVADIEVLLPWATTTGS